MNTSELKIDVMSGGKFLYQSNINIEAIKQIDNIVRMPKVNYNAIQSKEASEQPESTLSREAFKKLDFSEIVEEASRALETINTELTFRVHKGTGRTLVQLIERETKRVVREIPPEKMLDIVAGIWEWAGLIIDRKE